MHSLILGPTEHGPFLFIAPACSQLLTPPGGLQPLGVPLGGALQGG